MFMKVEKSTVSFIIASFMYHVSYVISHESKEVYSIIHHCLYHVLCAKCHMLCHMLVFPSSDYLYSFAIAIIWTRFISIIWPIWPAVFKCLHRLLVIITTIVFAHSFPFIIRLWSVYMWWSFIIICRTPSDVVHTLDIQINVHNPHTST